MAISNSILLIIVLSVICYILLYFVVKAKCTKLEIFTFTPDHMIREKFDWYVDNVAQNSDPNDPNVLIVATIHGNEPGYVGMMKLIRDIKNGIIRIKKGKVII